VNIHLQLFYNVMYKVVFDGFNKPIWFDPMSGLCSNYHDYLLHIGVISWETTIAMDQQFVDANLDNLSPFSTPEDNNFYNDKKYSNPLRLQWIKDHYDESLDIQPILNLGANINPSFKPIRR